MPRTEDGLVRLSIMLDQALMQRLHDQAARRSVSLAEYVEEIMRLATLKNGATGTKGAVGEKESSGHTTRHLRDEQLPRSVGLGDVDFDARETDAWLAVHWGRE